MNNSIQNQYHPDYVSPPGETLEEVLQERGMTPAYLGEKIGVSEKTINMIIEGKASISHEIARDLEDILKVSASFWNNRQKRYQEFLAHQNRQKTQQQIESKGEQMSTKEGSQMSNKLGK